MDACGRLVQRTPAAAAQLADLADVSRDAGDLLDGDLPSAVRSVLARPRAGRTRDEDVAPRELRARGRSGRWYTIRAMLTEPDASGCSNTIVLIAPLERRELAPLLAKLYGLSPREREVLTLVARGYSTKEIAARLRISSYTVQEHLGHASDKVGVRGRRALLARLFFDGYAERLHG